MLRLVSDPERPLSLRAACGQAGISHSSWSEWEQGDDDLKQSRLIAMAKGQATLESRALDPEIAGPASNVLRHRLGCLDADAWGERQVRIDGGKMTIAQAAAEARKPK